MPVLLVMDHSSGSKTLDGHRLSDPSPRSNPHIAHRSVTSLLKTLQLEMSMAHRLMKRCSASLIIREMQIHTAMSYHLPSVRISIIKKSTITNVAKDVGKKKNPCTLLTGM